MPTLPLCRRLFLFSVILTTGGFLKCEICSSPGSSCIGERELCSPAEDTCATISIANTLGDNTVQTVIKDCESSEICMTPGKSMNLGKGRTIRVYSTCCIEDDCALENPQLLPIENDTNGIQCPACFTTSNSCVPEIINCTGLEDYCFEMVSSASVGGKVIEATMKGCTTKNICLALEGGRSFPFKGSGMAVKKGKCLYRFSRASHTTGLLSLTFSGLLLMRIFL